MASLLTAAVIALLAFLLLRRLRLGYPRRAGPLRHLARREAVFLDAAAEALFPAGGAIPLAGRDADVAGYVDAYFGELHGGKRVQIRLLLLLMEQATLVFPAPGPRGRRRFSSLSPDQRDAVLRAWNESGWFVRRLVFTALRAVLTMGYLGHPRALRFLGLAPLAIDSPVVTADLLFPPVGRPRSEIRATLADLSPPGGRPPLDPQGRLHPAYAEGVGPPGGGAAP